MPSLSSFALAFGTRSDCLLAYSGLRFPSSTYFMATSTSSCSFCAKDHAIIRRLATSGHAVSHYRYPHHPTMRGRRCCSALEDQATRPGPVLVLRCVAVEDKVPSFDGLVAGKAGVMHRLVGGFAVVKLSEPPAAGRGVFS